MKPFKTKMTACLVLSITVLLCQARDASSDQVFAEDVVIHDSLCVGMDCADGENFSFDTIRLRENNLRLHFDDTSTSGAFPSNDWSIVINDSANGGDNYFAVQDLGTSNFPLTIEAGAADDTLVVDSEGRVGVGTEDPTESLHVVGNALITGNLELGSSRTYKDKIRTLETNDALTTLKALRPVRFYYKVAPEEESLGFIAEEVPDLVATNDRKSINPFDVIAVLASVAQKQQETIENLTTRIEELENRKHPTATKEELGNKK